MKLTENYLRKLIAEELEDLDLDKMEPEDDRAAPRPSIGRKRGKAPIHINHLKRNLSPKSKSYQKLEGVSGTYGIINSHHGFWEFTPISDAEHELLQKVMNLNGMKGVSMPKYNGETVKGPCNLMGRLESNGQSIQLDPDDFRSFDVTLIC